MQKDKTVNSIIQANLTRSTQYPRKSSEKEVYPNLEFRGPTCRDALHDSENAFLSRFGAEKVCKGWSFDEASMVEEEERIATRERGRKASEFSE